MRFWPFGRKEKEKEPSPSPASTGSILSRATEYLLREETALAAYAGALERLCAWNDEHPQLYWAHLDYYRGLVLDTIRAFERLLEMGLRSDKERLDFLYELLDRRPPPHSPPKASRPREAFSYARMRAELREEEAMTRKLKVYPDWDIHVHGGVRDYRRYMQARLRQAKVAERRLRSAAVAQSGAKAGNAMLDRALAIGHARLLDQNPNLARHLYGPNWRKRFPLT